MKKKIVVIGTSGSGKTTLAKHIAKTFNSPFIDLDDLYWLPNWTKKEPAQFLSDIQTATSAPSWIIAGNQSKAQHLFWPHADTIIWLDLPLTTCLYQALKRTLSNIFTQTPLCNGNYDSLRRLFSKNSILFWVLKTHAKRQQRHQNLLQNRNPHTRLVHLTSRREIVAFLHSLAPHTPPH